METEKQRSLNQQDSHHVYTESTEERNINPPMTNTEQMMQIPYNDAVTMEGFRWTALGTRSSNVFGKANETFLLVSP
jgi:hypothetical protein